MIPCDALHPRLSVRCRLPSGHQHHGAVEHVCDLRDLTTLPTLVAWPLVAGPTRAGFTPERFDQIRALIDTHGIAAVAKAAKVSRRAVERASLGQPVTKGTRASLVRCLASLGRRKP